MQRRERGRKGCGCTAEEHYFPLLSRYGVAFASYPVPAFHHPIDRFPSSTTPHRSTAQRNTNKKFAVWDIALGAFVFLELRNGMGWVDGGWAMGFNGAKMGILLILCLFIYLVFWESVGGIGYGSGFWERDGGRVGLWCF